MEWLVVVVVRWWLVLSGWRGIRSQPSWHWLYVEGGGQRHRKSNYPWCLLQVDTSITYLPLVPTERKSCENLFENKSPELRLNLSRSWHKGHSHTYNTSFLFKSYTEDLSFPIFKIVFQHRLSHL